jgi:hypothetical protein
VQEVQGGTGRFLSFVEGRYREVEKLEEVRG